METASTEVGNMTIPAHFSTGRHYPTSRDLSSSLTYSRYNRELLVELVRDKARRLTTSDNHSEALNALDEIGAILSRLDPPPSTILQTIDAKAQDLGMYFVMSYSDSRDFETAFAVYKLVRNLVRYVLLMDRFYEVGNQRYRAIAKGVLASISEKSELCPPYLLNHAIRRFWPFWSFEQGVKKLMLKGHRFSAAEIRHFNLLKASDAPIIYCAVLENTLPSFNPNVALVIHFNQGLEDIDDDFDDIKEDLRDRMPNVFLLAALASHNYSYPHLVRSLKKESHSIGAAARSDNDAILRMVSLYSLNIENMEIPSQFQFLKMLGRGYKDKIEKKIGADHYSDPVSSSLPL